MALSSQFNWQINSGVLTFVFSSGHLPRLKAFLKHLPLLKPVDPPPQHKPFLFTLTMMLKYTKLHLMLI
jgi:hypothetical protein